LHENRLFEPVIYAIWRRSPYLHGKRGGILIDRLSF